MIFFLNCIWQYLLNFLFSFGYMRGTGFGGFSVLFGVFCLLINHVLLFWRFGLVFFFKILIFIIL